MESETANLGSQIQEQQESLEAKDAAMKNIREQINQVLLPSAYFIHNKYIIIEVWYHNSCKLAINLCI